VNLSVPTAANIGVTSMIIPCQTQAKSQNGETDSVLIVRAILCLYGDLMNFAVGSGPAGTADLAAWPPSVEFPSLNLGCSNCSSF
jgi:hypothetical protein